MSPVSTVTPPSEIPLDKIALPKGFKVELWAHGLPGGRQMARGDKGKIYVGTRAAGRVYEITDDGDHRTVRRCEPTQCCAVRPSALAVLERCRSWKQH